jgi:hypothetical protein
MGTAHVPRCESLPMLGDVKAFLAFIGRSWQEGCMVLAEMLNTASSMQWRSSLAHLGGKSPLFVPEDVNKLLVNLPLYHFALHYPPHIDSDDIWKIYLCNGWLTTTDVGIFIKKVRRGKHLPLAQLQYTVKISESVLARLEEGTLERVKLNDVLMLDEQLGQEGKIPALYWKAYQVHQELAHFSTGIDFLKQEGTLSSREEQDEQLERLIFIFTLVCRWLQQGSQKEQGGIDELRKRLGQPASLVNVIGSQGDVPSS